MKQLRPLLVIFLLATTFLTACSQELDLTLYADKTWQLQDRLEVENDLLDSLGGLAGETLGQQFGLDLPALDTESAVRTALNTLTETYRQQGLQAEWSGREDKYSLRASGKTYPAASALAPGLLTIEPVPGAVNQYRLLIGVGALDGNLDFAAGLLDSTVRVHVGRIISCNNCERQGNTAIWRNPLKVDLVFSPALPPLALYLLIGLGLLTLAIGVGALLRAAGHKTCAVCGMKIPRRAEYCPYCGGMNAWCA